jgi:hypothetical protein
MDEPDICTICSGEFSLEDEGGNQGFIGMLPVTFCPTCSAGIHDFVESGCSWCIEREREEEEEDGSVEAS